MHEFITANQDRIVELCRKHHVQRLSIFGSAVRDDFDPERSDIDLLVEFSVSPSCRYARNFFSLQRELGHVLAREVDLVIEGSIKNPYLLKSIEDDVQLLYAA